MRESETAQIVEEQDANDFSLIDVSGSDDDFLLASSSDAVAYPGDILAEGACTNQPSESVELQPRKNGKCNLRKSLAWDSAFFTNAGVLDPEELSSIIEGAETSVKQNHFLPGIEEDLSKSYDSASTFESDNLTIESLEADLFCDVRASIQRTSRRSAQGNCSSTKVQGETQPMNRCSTKTAEISPGNMVKPKMASKKLDPSVQAPFRTIKSGSICKQVPKPAVRSKESKSLLPWPPEAAAKPSLIGPTSTKKTAIAAGRGKLENTTAGISKGKVASFSRVPHRSDSSNTAPKTLASSKFSSGSSVLGRGAAIRSSRSSCDSSSSSETIRKSQGEVNRRKADKNVNLPSGSKIRAPSRVAVKSKCRSGDSHLSDYLKSTSKLSASISPTSSISEWSTESSSSTATVNHRPIGLKPCPTSFQDIIVESNVPQSQNHFSDSVSHGHENQPTGLLNQSAKQPSTESSVSLSHPVSAKPSGLRMPSATIGFFDGVKAAAKTPSGGSRSRSALPSSLPRSGALGGTPSGTAGKPKVAVKPDSRRTPTNLKPVHPDDHSAGLPMTINAENVNSVSETSSKVSKRVLIDLGSEENGEFLNERNHAADSDSEATKDNLVVTKNKASPEGKLQSSTNHATIAVEDACNAVHITDSIADLTGRPFSKEGQSDKKEHKDVENVDTVSETSSKVLNSILLDPASVANGEVLNGEKHAADSSSEATKNINLVAAKKEASPEAKLHSSTNQATITVEDACNAMHIADCVQDLTDSLFSKEDQSNRKENSDMVYPSQGVGETDGPKISILGAYQDVGEILGYSPTGDHQDPGSGAIEVKQNGHAEKQVDSFGNHVKATNNEVEIQGVSNGKKQPQNLLVDEYINVAMKKQASPEVKLHSPTEWLTIAAPDACNAITGSMEDLADSPVSKEGQSNRREGGDVDNVYRPRGVYETDSPKISSLNAFQDTGDSATNENQHSAYGAIEGKQTGNAEKEMDGFGTEVEAKNNEIEINSESSGKYQSQNLLVEEDKSSSILSGRKHLCTGESEQNVNLSPGSHSLLCLEASPGTRTPFAIKNSVARLIEAYDKSAGLGVEALVRFDTLPSLEEGEKENC